MSDDEIPGMLRIVEQMAALLALEVDRLRAELDAARTDRDEIAEDRDALHEDALECLRAERAAVKAALRRGFDIAREEARISTHDGWHVTRPRIDWERAEAALAAAAKEGE